MGTEDQDQRETSLTAHTIGRLSKGPAGLPTGFRNVLGYLRPGSHPGASAGDLECVRAANTDRLWSVEVVVVADIAGVGAVQRRVVTLITAGGVPGASLDIFTDDVDAVSADCRGQDLSLKAFD